MMRNTQDLEFTLLDEDEIYEISSLNDDLDFIQSEVYTLDECKNLLHQVLTVNLVKNIDIFRKDRRNWLLAIQVHSAVIGSEIASLLFDTYFADDDIERPELALIWKKLLEKMVVVSPRARNTSLLWRQLGILEASIGNFDLALDYFKKSSEIGEELNDSIILGDNYFEIGLILRNQGKYNQAWDSFLGSEKNAKKINHLKTLVYSQGQRANLLAIQGDLNGAISLLKDSLRIWDSFDKDDDKNMQHTTLHTLGRIYMQSGRFIDAKEVLLKSLRLKEIVGERYDSTLRTKAMLAEILMSLGEYSEAKKYISEEAVETSYRIGSYLYAADALRTLSRIYFWEGDYSQASRLAKRSLDVARIASLPLSQFETSIWMIRMGMKRRRYLDALPVFLSLVTAFFNLKLTPKQMLGFLLHRKNLIGVGSKIK